MTDHLLELLNQNQVGYLEFPLPFETDNLPPYTFSEKTEIELFKLVEETFKQFRAQSIIDPIEIRKQAYDILTQAYHEFAVLTRRENPSDGTPPSRKTQSIIHLRTVGALEDYLFEHAKNVSLTCLVTGWNYFSEPKQHLADIHKVSVAGLFADIGMMRVPSRILRKLDDLNEEELAIIHKHPETSAQFVESMFTQKNFITTRIVLQHHERSDGSGYPSKLRLDRLEPHTHLLNVVDSYHSMVSKRYFRTAQNPLDALQTLNKEAKSRYCEKAVKCLNFRVAPYPVGSVAHFADQRLVQIVSLTNIPSEFDQVKIINSHQEDVPYNVPSTIRAFTPSSKLNHLKTVSIQGHLDRLEKPVDTFDLLQLYDYAKK